MSRSVIFLFMLVSVLAARGGEPCEISLRRETLGGWKGWTEAHFRHSQGAWMNGTLVVQTGRDEIKKFRAGYGFIIGWDFCRDDLCVVVQSQNAHGPYLWQLFELSSGEELDQFYRSKTDRWPGWVRDFTDSLHR